jgi:hypothetical protein
MSQAVPWTCPTCHTVVASAYCPDCGEKPLRSRELTLRGLLDQMFEAFTNIDSKLVRSLRSLLTRPGLLTVAFLEGRRKAFISPVFTTPLDSHLHKQPWSGIVPQLVAQRLATLHVTLEQDAPVFDQAVASPMKRWITSLPFHCWCPVPFTCFSRRQPSTERAGSLGSSKRWRSPWQWARSCWATASCCC